MCPNRRSVFIHVLRVLLVSVTAVFAGCSSDPVAVEIPASGQPAQIVLTEVEWAGGHQSRRGIRIDSATKRFAVLRCQNAPSGVPCTTLQLEREGDVVAPSIATLFLATKSPAFRALKADYPRPGTVVPPDPGSATLAITRDGLRRTIAWDETATLPNALVAFNCSLESAGGSLILCATAAKA